MVFTIKMLLDSTNGLPNFFEYIKAITLKQNMNLKIHVILEIGLPLNSSSLGDALNFGKDTEGPTGLLQML